jgi:splicing factor 1
MPARRITGTNNVPLGPYRRSQTVDGSGSPTPGAGSATTITKATTAAAVRPNHSRWNPAQNNQILALLNLPTALTSPMTIEQLDAYATDLRVKEITESLQVHAAPPSHRARSPSPAPTYDNMGRRTNTRGARYKKKLEDERHTLVEKAIKLIPEYKPPVDYKRQVKLQEKIYIPVNDYPEINFIGLILGPRGKDLKVIEEKTGARIFIRGRGSVKEGKVDRHHEHEEDLHCLMMADSEAKVAAGVAEIQAIIETAATTPEKQNPRKQDQLRAIAVANGTFRDDENRSCRICGERGHLRWDCPQRDSARSLEHIVCHRCGQMGHIARDCRAHAEPVSGAAASARGQFDQEYHELMAEIGFNKIIGGSTLSAPAQIEAAPAAVPWKKQPAAVAGPPPPPAPASVVGSSTPGVAPSVPPWLTAFSPFPSSQQSIGFPLSGLSPTNFINFQPVPFPNVAPPLPPVLTAQPPPPAYPPPPGSH